MDNLYMIIDYKQNIENFEVFYPILFLKTDIFAQLDII